MSQTNPAPILLYGIGAQKAATTWLFEQLDKAPGVDLPRPKELHYWDCVRAPFMTEFRYNMSKRFAIPDTMDGLRFRIAAKWKPALRARVAQAVRYRSIFHDRPEDHGPYLDYLGLARPGVRLVGDITPSYALLGRDTYAEMLASHSDVRFVFLMREPVARFWSGIRQRFREPLRRGGLSEAGLARLALQALHNMDDPDVRRSDYMRTITELEAAVPAERIHYGFFETLLDPEQGGAARAALAAFLSLPDGILNPAEQVHAGARGDDMPEDVRALAQHVLRPVHEGVAARFGDAVPAVWNRGAT
jgi:hypothetical protein